MSSHKKKSATPHGSHTSAPPIPELQGKLPGRVSLILQALQEKSQTLDSFEPTKSALETLLTPPRVQTEGDILNVLSATIGLPGTAGIAQGLIGGAKGAGRVPAGTLASNVPPKGGGEVVSSFRNLRVDQLDVESLKLEREILQLLGQKSKIPMALSRIDNAQSTFRFSKDVRISELTRAKLKRQLKELDIENPLTDEIFKAGDLGEQGLLKLRAKIRGASEAVTDKAKVLNAEFARLAKTKATLATQPRVGSRQPRKPK